MPPIVPLLLFHHHHPVRYLTLLRLLPMAKRLPPIDPRRYRYCSSWESMAMMRIERMLIQCCSRLVDFYYYYYSPQLLVVDYCQLCIPFAWTSRRKEEMERCAVMSIRVGGEPAKIQMKEMMCENEK